MTKMAKIIIKTSEKPHPLGATNTYKWVHLPPARDVKAMKEPENRSSQPFVRARSSVSLVLAKRIVPPRNEDTCHPLS